MLPQGHLAVIFYFYFFFTLVIVEITDKEPERVGDCMGSGP